jgi:hypothetical protein
MGGLMLLACLGGPALVGALGALGGRRPARRRWRRLRTCPVRRCACVAVAWRRRSPTPEL